ncbi:MAG: hypothetical protein ACM3OB_03245 [Acidobacteriota bacterium]
MSLISEALRRAREHAMRQGDASATPPPFPILPPPPRERPRNLIALSVATSLAVSLLVAGGLYLLLARPAAAPAPAPATPPAKSAGTPQEAADGARSEEQTPSARPEKEAPRRELSAARPTPTPAPSTPPELLAQRNATVPVDPYPATTPTAATPLRPAPATAPIPPATRDADTKASAVQLPNGTRVTLDGIVWGDAPIAMLNGRLMSAGERLGSYTLARIEQRRVTLLDDNGKTYVVDLVR